MVRARGSVLSGSANLVGPVGATQQRLKIMLQSLFQTIDPLTEIPN